MRVTQNTHASLYARQSEDARQSIAKLQQQISTGKRLQLPSDDPAGTGKTVQIENSLNRLTQYERNGNYIESRLNMEEAALRNITTSLTSLRELALRTNNDTLGPKDYAIYLEDLNHRREEITTYLNGEGAHGDYLFSGTDRTTKPLSESNEYQGNEGVQSINIGLNSTLQLGTPAPKVMEYDSDGTSTDIFKTIDQLESILDSASTNNKPDEFNATMAVLIKSLDDAQTHMASLQADVGHRLSRLDTIRENNTHVELMLTSDINDIQGLDLAEAISTLETKIQSLEAIQSTYARLNNLSLFNFIS